MNCKLRASLCSVTWLRLNKETEDGQAVFAAFPIHVNYRHQMGGSTGSELGFCGQRLVAELKRIHCMGSSNGIFSVGWSVKAM